MSSARCVTGRQVVFALLAGFLATALAPGMDIRFPDAPEGTKRFFPTQAQPTTLEVVAGESDRPVAGAEVKVTFRPNAHSRVQAVQVVGKTDSAGRISWSPLDAGVASIMAEGGGEKAEKLVSVKFSPYPTSGLFIMIFAGAVLMGTILLSLVRMISSD